MMLNIPELNGQTRPLEYLNRALREGRIPHALILSGPKGSGKLKIAKAFAMEALKTDNPQFPDIVEIDLNEPGVKYVELIRTCLTKNITIGPYRGDYKFYIIAGAGKMPKEAQNAILKSLEEPPEYASIIMLTEDPARLLPTIRSRSIKLFIKPVEESVVEEYLKSQGVLKDRARVAAKLSMGNLAKSFDIANDEGYIDLAERTGALVLALSKGMAPAAFSEEVKACTEDMDKFLQLMEIIVRDVLVYKLSGNEEEIVFPWPAQIKGIATNTDIERLGLLREKIVKTRIALLSNVSKELLLELLLVEIGGNVEKSSRSAV